MVDFSVWALCRHRKMHELSISAIVPGHLLEFLAHCILLLAAANILAVRYVAIKNFRLECNSDIADKAPWNFFDPPNAGPTSTSCPQGLIVLS